MDFEGIGMSGEVPHRDMPKSSIEKEETIDLEIQNALEEMEGSLGDYLNSLASKDLEAIENDILNPAGFNYNFFTAVEGESEQSKVTSLLEKYLDLRSEEEQDDECKDVIADIRNLIQ